jgi:uncharacterized protein (DUF952 family)
METLYHITTLASYEKALELGHYVAESLYTEKFIHMSTIKQVLATYKRFYKNSTETLVVLILDFNDGLNHPIKYEPATDVQDLFPHYFNPIPLKNIEKIVKIKDDSFIEELS